MARRADSAHTPPFSRRGSPGPTRFRFPAGTAPMTKKASSAMGKQCNVASQGGYFTSLLNQDGADVLCFEDTVLMVDIRVAPGSHATKAAVNKQLNDKERVAGALEKPNLLDMVEECLSPTFV